VCVCVCLSLRITCSGTTGKNIMADARTCDVRATVNTWVGNYVSQESPDKLFFVKSDTIPRMEFIPISSSRLGWVCLSCLGWVGWGWVRLG
jgi:hypothetical protein